MASLLDLADEMDKLAGTAIPQEVSDFTVKVAITILTDLVYHTPVDTSKALSNWLGSLDAPAVGTIDAHFPGEKGSSQRASAAETIDAAKAVWASKQPGQSIFITNNLPYIQRLNEGYSGQQPAGFVERAELIGSKLIPTFKLKQ